MANIDRSLDEIILDRNINTSNNTGNMPVRAQQMNRNMGDVRNKLRNKPGQQMGGDARNRLGNAGGFSGDARNRLGGAPQGDARNKLGQTRQNTDARNKLGQSGGQNMDARNKLGQSGGQNMDARNKLGQFGGQNMDARNKLGQSGQNMDARNTMAQTGQNVDARNKLNVIRKKTSMVQDFQNQQNMQNEPRNYNNTGNRGGNMGRTFNNLQGRVSKPGGLAQTIQNRGSDNMQQQQQQQQQRYHPLPNHPEVVTIKNDRITRNPQVKRLGPQQRPLMQRPMQQQQQRQQMQPQRGNMRQNQNPFGGNHGGGGGVNVWNNGMGGPRMQNMTNMLMDNFSRINAWGQAQAPPEAFAMNNNNNNNNNNNDGYMQEEFEDNFDGPQPQFSQSRSISDVLHRPGADSYNDQYMNQECEDDNGMDFAPQQRQQQQQQQQQRPQQRQQMSMQQRPQQRQQVSMQQRPQQRQQVSMQQRPQQRQQVTMQEQPIQRKRQMNFYEEEDTVMPPPTRKPLLSHKKSSVMSRLDQPLQTPAQGYKVMVSNLHRTVTIEDIEELFGNLGSLRSTRLLQEGIAEVVFVNQEDAFNAVKIYHNRQLDGMPMNVAVIAKKSDNRARMGGGSMNNMGPKSVLRNARGQTGFFL